GMVDRFHLIDITRDHPAKTEKLLPLGHDYRAVGCREGGNEMGDIENRLIEKRQFLVLASDVFLPADDSVGLFRVAIELGEGAHYAQHEEAETLARLFFAKLVFDGHVTVFAEDFPAHRR